MCIYKCLLYADVPAKCVESSHIMFVTLISFFLGCISWVLHTITKKPSAQEADVLQLIKKCDMFAYIWMTLHCYIFIVFYWSFFRELQLFWDFMSYRYIKRLTCTVSNAIWDTSQFHMLIIWKLISDLVQGEHSFVYIPCTTPWIHEQNYSAARKGGRKTKY